MTSLQRAALTYKVRGARKEKGARRAEWDHKERWAMLTHYAQREALGGLGKQGRIMRPRYWERD